MECRKLILLTAILSFNLAFSQQIRVSSSSCIQQLPSKSVTRIHQDSAGYIWMGTLDGLCRYDGYRVLTFRSGYRNPDFLTSNRITALAEDDRYLFVGTNKGLNLLDKKTLIIKPFDENIIPLSEIKTICISSDATIWIGTENELYRLNRDLTLKKHYGEMPSQSVNHVFEDNQGRIWIAIWGNGLFLYEATGDRFISYPPIGKGNCPFRIFQDDRNRLWIGTWGDGLYLFKPDNKDQMFVKQTAANERSYFSLVQDRKFGYIWTLSLSGVSAFSCNGDGELEKVDVSGYFRDYNNIFSEISGDSAGNLWIGAFSEGVVKINFDMPETNNFTLPKIKERTGITANLTALFCRGDEIWFNQDRSGLGIFNMKTGDLQLYGGAYSNFDLANIACIKSLSSLSGEVWLGMLYRPVVQRITKEGDKVKLLESIDLSKITKTAEGIRLIYEDRRGNALIATASNLFVFLCKTKEIKPLDIPFTGISGVAEDAEGQLWAGTENNGLYRFTIDESNKISSLRHLVSEAGQPADKSVVSLCADSNGDIWYVTGRGNIAVCRLPECRFSEVTDSVMPAGEQAVSVSADRNGNVWFAANSKIVAYSPSSGLVKEYSEADGLKVNSFISGSNCIDDSGNMYFGGNRGFSVFKPTENEPVAPHPARIMFDDVKIDGVSVFNDNNNQSFVPQDFTLTLNPKDRNIEIDFSTLNYTFPSKIRYAYKLEGKDADWVYTGKGRQYAFYNSFSRGRFRLLVRATDENGVWQTETAALNIYRRPAIYETVWAFGIYGLIGLALLYFVFIFTKRRIKLVNELKIAQIEKDKSEEVNHVKLQFFTNITHEFLTPLTILSASVDELKDTSPREDGIYQTMSANISRLIRLLQQILEFRKAESGNLKLKVSEGDIAEFISAGVNNFIPLMKKKQIHCSLICQPETIRAYFDHDKLDKIIYNLLSNAAKYSNPGGFVLVNVRQQKEPENTVIITVKDSGQGIEPQAMKSLFKRFYEGDYRRFNTTGTGIGLSLTKDLVTLHKGEIGVESAPGKGTMFTVKLPISSLAYSDEEMDNIVYTAENKEDTKPLDADGNDLQKKYSLLIVEDNQELLQLMVKILSKEYRIHTAGNGLEGIQILENENIDIALSDIMMPEMDGMEFCRYVKNKIEISHIPIILLTAKREEEDRIEAYDSGADDFISKPFNVNVLQSKIKSLLKARERTAQKFKRQFVYEAKELNYSDLDEIFLNRAVDCVNRHIADAEFDQSQFADALGVSKSTLYKKLKMLTGLNTSAFIRNIRLKTACKLIEEKRTKIRISELSYSVGFDEPRYFSASFKKEFGMLPSDYLKKIGGEGE